MLIFILFWLVLFGSAIGSFLNVVIYRFPAGLSLLFPPSHCPKCKHPIRWYDNVPVFGWLMLRGKCRDCGLPISARYPMIEAICGLIFGFVGFVFLYGRFPGGVPAADFESRLVLVACNSLLLTTLLAAGMIEFDRKKVPVKLFVPIIFFGILICMEYRQQHPMPFFQFDLRMIDNSKPPLWYANWGGGIDAIVGAIAAVFFSCALFPVIRKEQRSGVVAANIAAGLLFGWQLSLCAMLAMLVVLVLARFFAWRQLPGLTLLVFCTVWLMYNSTAWR